MTRIILALLLLPTAALAQHQHPTETITGATALFYETWMRPDQPTVSCCNRSDCAVVREVRQRGNRWEARRELDGQWLVIPPDKMEWNRDSPDGLSHMCSVGQQVFCFKLGAGG